MTGTVIQADALSKRYEIGAASDGADLRAAIASAFGRLAPGRRPVPAETARSGFWALRDVSFAVERGDVFGIIGRNGAGKSTLLKILARITPPTSGSAWVEGRVGSLLEVGTGFHPELSGRENTYLNGAILGMGREEIAARYDSIVEYAGIADFMETPVKRYSSGMRVRLAFAIAAHIDPEVLILDEVLNVGDVEFRRKSTASIFEIINRGSTVLFVSHNMESVRSLCNKVLYLDHGTVRFLGDTDTAIDMYLDDLKESGQRSLLDVERRPGHVPLVTAVRLCDTAGDAMTTVPSCGAATLEIDLANESAIEAPEVDVYIRGARGGYISCISSAVQDPLPETLPPRATIRVHMAEIALLPGMYFISLEVGCANQPKDVLEHAVELHVVDADVFGTGRLNSNERGQLIVRARFDVTSKPL